MSSPTPLTLTDLPSLRGLSIPELSSQLVLELEDSSHVVLRGNYLDQIHRMCNNLGGVDTSWLHCTSNAVFFLTRAGLPLKVFRCDPAPPPLRRANGIHSPTDDATRESLHLVFDQSGSMHDMNGNVYSGAKEVVDGLPDDAVVTFTTFNHNVTLGQRRSKAEILEILSAPRRTEGTTALRDALRRAIEQEESEPYQKTTIIIVTDGFDNKSTTTVEQLRQAVGRCNARNWRILFLGANQDAVMTASQYGIDVDRALTFDGARAPEAFRSLSENVRTHRETGVEGFSSLQRQSSVVT